MFPIINAGGRVQEAIRSITVAKHMFDIKNVVVVHHTQCGATTLTPHGLYTSFEREHGRDITGLLPVDEIGFIENFTQSLKRDVRVVRFSPGTTRSMNIYGYLFDIDTDELRLVVEDLGS